MRLNTTRYKVVINHEEQYSIMPADTKLSRGVRDLGVVGSKETCLKYIEEVWTDMKPSDKDRILSQIGG